MDRNPDGATVCAGDAKRRVREWGLEAQAAHAGMVQRALKFAPWAAGGAGLALVFSLLSARRGRKNADGSGVGVVGGGSLWPVLAGLAVRYAPMLIGVLIRPRERASAAQQAGTSRSE